MEGPPEWPKPVVITLLCPVCANPLQMSMGNARIRGICEEHGVWIPKEQDNDQELDEAFLAGVAAAASLTGAPSDEALGRECGEH